MQSSQDPTNPTGQSSSSSQPEHAPSPLASDSVSPTVQRYQPSPYSQAAQPLVPPPQPPPSPLPQRNGWKIVSLLLFILVLILGTAITALVLTRPSSSTRQQIGQTVPTSVATQLAAMPTTTSGSSFILTTTPTSQITPDVTSTALAADGTITENKLLTCSSCRSGDPIQFTIDSITIDNANGRTVWNVTLKNVSGNYYYVYNYNNQGITLQESAGTNQPVPATGYSVPQMAPEDKDTTQLIFAFVPHKGAQYTFSAHILTNSNIDMPFDPVNFTF